MDVEKERESLKGECDESDWNCFTPDVTSSLIYGTHVYKTGTLSWLISFCEDLVAGH